MERRQQLAYPVIVIDLWTMMILLGAIVLETFMIYPNIFHDPPRSLELAMEFMSVSSPHDFFPSLGLLSWIAGAGALALSWPVRQARWWIALSLLMIVADGVASMLLFWPRNQIMFVEGTALHSAEVLRQTAWEFQTLHWLRVIFNAASAAFIFVGFVRFDRWRLLATVERPGAPRLEASAPGARLPDRLKLALRDGDPGRRRNGRAAERVEPATRVGEWRGRRVAIQTVHLTDEPAVVANRDRADDRAVGPGDGAPENRGRRVASLQAGIEERGPPLLAVGAGEAAGEEDHGFAQHIDRESLR